MVATTHDIFQGDDAAQTLSAWLSLDHGSGVYSAICCHDESRNILGILESCPDISDTDREQGWKCVAEHVIRFEQDILDERLIHLRTGYAGSCDREGAAYFDDHLRGINAFPRNHASFPKIRQQAKAILTRAAFDDAHAYNMNTACMIALACGMEDDLHDLFARMPDECAPRPLTALTALNSALQGRAVCGADDEWQPILPDRLQLAAAQSYFALAQQIDLLSHGPSLSPEIGLGQDGILSPDWQHAYANVYGVDTRQFFGIMSWGFGKTRLPAYHLSQALKYAAGLSAESDEVAKGRERLCTSATHALAEHCEGWSAFTKVSCGQDSEVVRRYSLYGSPDGAPAMAQLLTEVACAVPADMPGLVDRVIRTFDFVADCYARVYAETGNELYAPTRFINAAASENGGISAAPSAYREHVQAYARNRQCAATPLVRPAVSEGPQNLPAARPS